MKQLVYQCMTLLCIAYPLAIKAGAITAPISMGELIDKMTILELKQEYIDDEKKRANVSHELAILNTTLAMTDRSNETIDTLREELREINRTLWHIEDAIREKERVQQFDDEFVQLARKVYFTNDRRSQIKRQINIAAHSPIVEEKSYTDYQTHQAP